MLAMQAMPINSTRLMDMSEEEDTWQTKLIMSPN
jgi:hypothetical protein